MELNRTLAELKSLPVADRLRAGEELWDSIESDQAIEMSPEQRAELDRKIAVHEQNPAETFFLRECRASLDRMVEQPNLWAADETGIRSIRIRRFPHVVHYRIEKSTVIVFAVMFGGRDPSSWRGRI